MRTLVLPILVVCLLYGCKGGDDDAIKPEPTCKQVGDTVNVRHGIYWAYYQHAAMYGNDPEAPYYLNIDSAAIQVSFQAYKDAVYTKTCSGYYTNSCDSLNGEHLYWTAYKQKMTALTNSGHSFVRAANDKLFEINSAIDRLNCN
jgi:hypothetical protein